MPTTLQPLKLLAILCTFFISINAAAQTTIRFKVTEKNNSPVAFATLKAVLLEDTTIAVQRLTDSLGRSVITLETGKQYRITVSSINYKPLEKGITTKGAEMSINLVVEPAEGEISNVTVTSTRPLMRQEDDKTIVEPEALAAASTNAYEILEKTPGVFLDQDGNVYLSSATPSLIYINGREMRMSTADIATMLKNLPPNAISKSRSFDLHLLNMMLQELVVSSILY